VERLALAATSPTHLCGWTVYNDRR